MKRLLILILSLSLLCACAKTEDLPPKPVTTPTEVRGVFDAAYERMVKRKEEHEEQYHAVLAQLETLSEGSDEYRSVWEASGEQEMVLDMDSQICNLLRKIVETEIFVGQTNGVMELSQIAVLGQSIFFAFTAPPECAFDETPIITVNGTRYEGMDYSAFLLGDMADAAQYKAYRCLMEDTESSLPETMLITAENGDSRFCFRYVKDGHRVELAETDAGTDALNPDTSSEPASYLNVLSAEEKQKVLVFAKEWYAENFPNYKDLVLEFAKDSDAGYSQYPEYKPGDMIILKVYENGYPDNRRTCFIAISDSGYEVFNEGY